MYAGRWFVCHRANWIDMDMLFCLAVTWSDWSNWSVCSVQPCHSNGIQTRHRSCLSNGQPVADQACFNLEGTSVDTQPCDCPVVRVATTEEPVTAVTTPTFVRTGGQFHIDSPRQPQRPLSVQVQNRPIQRRPSTTIPRTCSALEKPCNNGQCILSYRICTSSVSSSRKL